MNRRLRPRIDSGGVGIGLFNSPPAGERRPAALMPNALRADSVMGVNALAGALLLVEEPSSDEKRDVSDGRGLLKAARGESLLPNGGGSELRSSRIMGR